MCAGCVQSGVEFAAANGLLLASGARCSARRVLDRFRPSADAPAARRAKREAEVATFLEALHLDPGPILGWPEAPDGLPTAAPSQVDANLTA